VQVVEDGDVAAQGVLVLIELEADAIDLARDVGELLAELLNTGLERTEQSA
jgi:hypothetical protein